MSWAPNVQKTGINQHYLIRRELVFVHENEQVPVLGARRAPAGSKRAYKNAHFHV